MVAMRLPLLLAAAFAAFVPAIAQEGPPNAPDQKPAFPGQTRAPKPAGATPVVVTPIASGLRGGWGFEFLPDGRILVTENRGALRIVGKDGTAGPAIEGVPAVDARGQGG